MKVSKILTCGICVFSSALAGGSEMKDGTKDLINNSVYSNIVAILQKRQFKEVEYVGWYGNIYKSPAKIKIFCSDGINCNTSSVDSILIDFKGEGVCNTILKEFLSETGAKKYEDYYLINKNNHKVTAYCSNASGNHVYIEIERDGLQ